MNKIWKSLPLLGKTQASNPKTPNLRRRTARRLVVHLQPPYAVFYFIVASYGLSALLIIGLSVFFDLFYTMYGLALLIPIIFGSWIAWCSFLWAKGLVSLRFDGGVWLLMDKHNQEYEVQIQKSTFVHHALLVMPLVCSRLRDSAQEGLSLRLSDQSPNGQSQDDKAPGPGKYVLKSLILSPYWINPKEYRRLCVLLWTHTGRSDDSV